MVKEFRPIASIFFVPMYLGTRTIASAIDTKKSRNTPTAMVQWALSRTLSLLGVAILVHLIVMTSVAEKGKIQIRLSFHAIVNLRVCLKRVLESVFRIKSLAKTWLRNLINAKLYYFHARRSVWVLQTNVRNIKLMLLLESIFR